MQKPLEPGDELHCPHCRRWHTLVTTSTEGTPYAVAMLFFECVKGLYYAGQVGGTSRFETRRAPPIREAISAPWTHQT